MRQDYPANGFRICVDTEEQDMAGRIYSLLAPEVITYSGWNELFLKMDAIFDRVGYPQAFQEKRSFTGGTKAEALTAAGSCDARTGTAVDRGCRGHKPPRRKLAGHRVRSGQAGAWTVRRGTRADETIRTERETNGRVEASVRFFFLWQ